MVRGEGSACNPWALIFNKKEFCVENIIEISEMTKKSLQLPSRSTGKIDTAGKFLTTF